MYKLKSVISRSEECDDCNSTRESRMLDIEEGVELKNKNDSLEKISTSSCNFFMGNKDSFIRNGKMEKIKKKHKEEKKIKIIDIINCPLDLHTNFISMILFIIGSTFFLFPKLYVSGCIIFAIACALCLYSNLIGVIRTNEEKKIEYYGYICYVIGCVVFIVGSIYCCFKDDYFAVLTFIIGSFYFLVGALFFIYAIDFNNIKNVNWKIIVVYISNFVGGLLFTIASIMFFYQELYNVACFLYIQGSVLFTLATWLDYLNYLNNSP
ncbi:conserved Plasmodium protein, unknown function [Plasmodium ovale]|uniref:YrhK domain-containing protein n=2 Tax=Plasmodium ovale TaxID=36330 RepID=A0A1A8WZR9_PLAOA|nr:conserved Plasmodium protein, unknown function [Plasmodium ovale curtisi]SBS97396.1 conserved Plasmodium protein, unknown function [Plasmodium ovale curtisi]SCP06056.1 conserved Plasmodium protein, unknown function [Plasmodium ovale]